MTSLDTLLKDVKSCTICQQHLPLGPRPVLQVHPNARILIASQAPGRKVHESGIPFDDASGNRLRDWMGISKDVFYDAKQIAILPMGFCFPGTGKSGDLPPRPECEATWRKQLLGLLPNIQTTLVIGMYAQAYHFKIRKPSVTQLVSNWKAHWPALVPLPHPSPRNNIWLRKNPWFETQLLPPLKKRITDVLK
ncbi:MAG: uracil-DNA glycosylase family protein [Cycloclasticus sp.]